MTGGWSFACSIRDLDAMIALVVVMQMGGKQMQEDRGQKTVMIVWMGAKVKCH